MPALEEQVRESVADNGGGGMAARVEQVKQNLADQAERRLRDVKRLARKGQFALEDGVDEIGLRVRKNPGKALAIAFAVGTVAGAVLGFAARRRRPIA